MTGILTSGIWRRGGGVWRNSFCESRELETVGEGSREAHAYCNGSLENREQRNGILVDTSTGRTLNSKVRGPCMEVEVCGTWRGR